MSVAILNESLLDEKLSALEAARTWNPRVISKLETTIRTADDYDLFRVNPLQYAGEKGMTEGEAIDLFLYSTQIGLFEMDWHLVCAGCGHVVESLRELKNLHPNFECNFCSTSQTAELDDFIQVTFTISAQVRDIRYHHPESLSLEDYHFRYQMSKGVAPYPDGTTYESFAQNSTRLLAGLMPGEKRTVEFDALPGNIITSNFTHFLKRNFPVDGQQAPAPQAISLQLMDGKLQASSPAYSSNGQEYSAPMTFSSGRMTLDVENAMSVPTSIWVFNFAMKEGYVPIRLHPFLSGKRLLTNQTFRNLFRSESVGEDEGIGVKDITFLFTDLKGSTAMYDQIGDPKAYYLVRQHFDTLGKAVTRHSGAVVKTIGDAIMATFVNPVDAVQAALDMITELDSFNRRISEDLNLKIGIHTGHSIAVTLNERLDYFGQTVNIASRVQGLADGDEIYLSHDAYIYPGVSEALAGCMIEPEQVAVKGVSDQLQVYKVVTK